MNSKRLILLLLLCALLLSACSAKTAVNPLAEAAATLVPGTNPVMPEA